MPLVDGRVHVKAFVALQMDQPSAKKPGQHFGDFSLTQAGMAFQQHWFAQPGPEKDNCGQGCVRDVTLLLQPADYVARFVDLLPWRKRWWHGVVVSFFPCQRSRDRHPPSNRRLAWPSMRNTPDPQR